MLYKYYIGHNNKTKKVEEKKALKIISKQFDGFTAFKGLGYWQGKAEKTLIIEIETNNKKAILITAKKIARELKQETIGLATIGKMNFIGA